MTLGGWMVVHNRLNDAGGMDNCPPLPVPLRALGSSAIWHGHGTTGILSYLRNFCFVRSTVDDGVGITNFLHMEDSEASSGAHCFSPCMKSQRRNSSPSLFEFPDFTTGHLRNVDASLTNKWQWRAYSDAGTLISSDYMPCYYNYAPLPSRPSVLSYQGFIVED
jgi:hypothetical protein